MLLKGGKRKERGDCQVIAFLLLQLPRLLEVLVIFLKQLPRPLSFAGQALLLLGDEFLSVGRHL